MKPMIVHAPSLQLDIEQLLQRLHIRPDSPQVDELQGLVREAEEIGRPKALTGAAFIEERGDDWVRIDDIRFGSRVLRVNLDGAHRVFPFIATSGAELEAWADAPAIADDMLYSFWSEAIREAALAAAVKALDCAVDEAFRPGETARMNPGSLTDWPLREQRPLFALLGDPEASIGVRLTPSLLMVPKKTVSGIRFSTARHFESCQLCPRDVCPGRRAPYDPDLYDARYRREKPVPE